MESAIGLGMLALGALCMSGCTDPDNSRRVLTDSGYSKIELAAHSGWFDGCAKDDWYSTPFSAVGPGGRLVTGVVCQGIGWGKASTIRLY